MNEKNPNFETLNEKQKEAIVSDAKRLLVLAGAGAGKTKTLLEKIKYLIDEKGVKSSEILAITFTKNAANEMLDRLIISADKTGTYKKILLNKTISIEKKNNYRYNFSKNYNWINNLTIKTFHAFCFKILKDYGVNEFDNQFKILENKKYTTEALVKFSAPETSFEIFHKLLIENCNNNNEYLLDLKRYILDYFVDFSRQKKYRHYTPYDNHKLYSTLNGTQVRSKSEQFIADWLFRRNIEFVYEPEVIIQDFNFHPDFFIPSANIFIEHVSNRSYPTKNKEEQFRKGNILYVKTFEAQTKDSALFSHTLDQIIKNRLPENYNKKIKLSYLEAFNGYQVYIKDFIVQIMQITDMIKVENYRLKTILNKAIKDQHERVRNFFKLAIPIIEKYKKYCTNKSYLDFNDLISTSISLLKNNLDISSFFHNRFKYILVDEFQDVNNLQVALLKLLITNKTQLFCVGDDWQSIYGFRGSNVNYIINFKRHFKNANLIKLKYNYRSIQNIVEASSEVIKNNKYKIEKEIVASRKSTNKITVYAGNDVSENVEFAVNEVKKLLDDDYKNEDILFLYRRTKMYSDYYNAFKLEGLKVQAKTIHSAKGLEAKVVFVIGLKEGYGGFPDIWLADRIFQVVKKSNHDLLLEEERRLFYVAITRAKDKLFLLTEKGNESSFIREIPDNYTVKTQTHTNSAFDDIIICKNCQSQLEKLFAFCPYCGEAINK